MKWICLIEVNLQRKLSDLESWLTDSGSKSEIIRSKTQKVNLIYSRNILIRQPKNQENSITLVLTFHFSLSTSYCFWCIKEGALAYTKVNYVKTILPKPTSVASRNPKTLHDRLVCSKLKLTYDAEGDNFPFGRGCYEVCNISKLDKEQYSNCNVQ